jgi:2-polyprenyl-3-methyl-5-hydroxy-6-metoxy-1,4-benzoquinol methylase
MLFQASVVPASTISLSASVVPSMARMINGPCNISAIIGSVNGKEWLKRRSFVPTLVTPQIHVLLSGMQSDESLKGQGVYAASDAKTEVQNTNYDIVNSWQVNFVRCMCNLDGVLLSVNEECWSDDAMFKSFHSNRSHATVLDVGCNTGKNMLRAIQYAGKGIEVFGIEFSPDSVAVAQEAFGKEHAIQGDASTNLVDQHGWSGRFSAVQCTAVLQHMTPAQVDAVVANMSRCLKSGGELL